jgi:hypothetical protein
VTNVPTLAGTTQGDFSQSLFRRANESFHRPAVSPAGEFRTHFIKPDWTEHRGPISGSKSRDSLSRNFVSSPVQEDRDDRFDVRVDHLLNSRSSLAFRYSFGDRGLFEPFAGAGFSVVPGTATT